MGYGEYGGNGSIQVTNWLSNPEPSDVKADHGKGPWEHAHGKNPTRLSPRAVQLKDDIADDDETFTGKDKSIGSSLGRFMVTINFDNGAELAAALAEFNAAASAQERSVSFFVKVQKNRPGQIQIAWGEHAPPSPSGA